MRGTGLQNHQRPCSVMAMTMNGATTGVAFLALCSIYPLHVRAEQPEIGTVATLEGTAEIGRGGTWLAAEVGFPVQQDDVLRTGTPGHLSVVFQDDTVLTLGDGSELSVSEHLFAPEGGSRSLIDLVSGTVSAVVSDYYRKPSSAYEVKTKTATAGVRGTEFVVTYEPADKITEVFVVDGRVEVTSVVDDVDNTVFLEASEVTYVRAGELPSAPSRFDEGVLRQRLDHINFIGESAFEGLAARSLIGVNIRAARPPVASAAGSSDLERKRLFEANDLLGQNPASVGRRSLGIRF